MNVPKMTNNMTGQADVRLCKLGGGWQLVKWIYQALFFFSLSSQRSKKEKQKKKKRRRKPDRNLTHTLFSWGWIVIFFFFLPILHGKVKSIVALYLQIFSTKL